MQDVFLSLLSHCVNDAAAFILMNREDAFVANCEKFDGLNFNNGADVDD